MRKTPFCKPTEHPIHLAWPILRPQKREGDAVFGCTYNEGRCPQDSPYRGSSRGGREDTSYDECLPIPRKVLKERRHLLRAANYCRRYGPAAHHLELVDTSTSHMRLRCIVRQAGAAL